MNKWPSQVPSLDRTLITVGVYEKGNIWLGPKFVSCVYIYLFIHFLIQ